MPELTDQQLAVLEALYAQSPTATPDLYGVRVGGTNYRRGYPIGDPVGHVLRRLERRGLVTGEMDRGRKEWWISDDGLQAVEDCHKVGRTTIDAPSASTSTRAAHPDHGSEGRT